jgi:hypothetical protein
MQFENRMKGDRKINEKQKISAGTKRPFPKKIASVPHGPIGKA